MLTLTWIRGLTGMRAGRLAGATVGIAIAVALLAALGSFLGSSRATMTTRSVQQVAVDWQVEVQPGTPAASVMRAVNADPRVSRAMPVGYATTTGLQATAGGTTLTTGAGKVLGLPASYATTFPGEIRFLTGSRDGVLLAQQTAANLHAAPGDRISLGRAGLPPVTVRVDGIVDLPQADSLFQTVGAPVGAQPTAPPDNVVLMPQDRWHQVFDPVAKARPDQVRAQVHARTRHNLPPDPAAAYAVVTGAAHNLEARLAGGGLVGDNLAATLDSARQDASYAQLLFLFLGVPGAVLAGLLTGIVTASGADRRRAEQALLRARGANSSQLLRLAVAEAVLVGVVGSAAGLGIAALVGRLAFGSAAFGSTAGASTVWAAVSVAIGLLVAIATVAWPARRDLRASTVMAARQPVALRRRPRWMRYGLDIWLLVAFGLAFWATSSNGYQLVLAPEGVPTISVSYWAFAAPALLWAGAGLLAWRLVDLLLREGRPVLSVALRPLAGPLSGTVAATMSRQRRLLARTVVLVMLAVAFAASTATFDATFRQQAEVDAQLTNGADVTVTAPPTATTSPARASTLAAIPGVAKVGALQHRYAYIGPDLQDLYGIDPHTLGRQVRLQDAYFAGGTAKDLLGRLARQPDAILVSAETVHDYQLHPGDLIRLRLVEARTHRQLVVPFHYVGVVKEFPTAPKDSFFVTNASYVARRTGNPVVGEFLLTTDGTPPTTVAQRVRSTLGPNAQVSDIQTTRAVVGSSLTAVDLSGLTKVELSFAIVLAASATGLLLLLGFAERRRTFALLRAIGARPNQLAALVRSEVSLVAVLGAVLGAAAGWGLAAVLVAELAGVFDPPPDSLAVPWRYLAVVAFIGLICTIAAGVRAVSTARRPALEVLRDL
ncbi:FtsX-like permease family protein [Actinopolymorpha alba]|uniref:FtsX-like permease family protein n=1 Tax=Actinopolymorpha alba TaxID=533267 RepID=UPI0003637E11|nr:ABC transporter permease [Actinopolymorpha alba]